MLTDVDFSMYGIYNEADKKLVIKFLESRNITTPAQVEQVFNPSADDELDIMQAKDATLWMSKLFDLSNTVITIVGDYDGDGIMASTVARQGLTALGVGTVLHQYVPVREDGYGLSAVSVDKLMATYPDTQTILTVDNGVVAYDGVHRAKELGLHVLVTDHHLGAEQATDADAVVDINRPDDDFAFKGLSGTAVIWKLLLAYAKTVASPQVVAFINNMSDYVGISTVTDIMPVRGENRYYIKQALSSINERKRYQWHALFESMAKHKKQEGKHMVDGPYDEEFIGFTLGPMLNAVGRVTGSPEIAYKFFQTEDYSEMLAYADQLYEINKLRQDEVKRFTAMAEDLYQGEAIPDAVLVALPLKIGYAGLVAAKLEEAFNAPVLVAGGTRGIVHGSARSPHWFDLIGAMQTLQDEGLLLQFGGHAAAAGFTIDTQYVDVAQQRLQEIAQETVATMPLDEKPSESVGKPDIDIRLEEQFAQKPQVATDTGLTGGDDLMELADMLNKMAPFGEGFRAPMVRVTDVNFNDAFRMGNEKQHAKVAYGDLSVIAWNVPNEWDRPVSVYGRLSINKFTNYRKQTIITPQVIANKIV